MFEYDSEPLLTSIACSLSSEELISSFIFISSAEIKVVSDMEGSVSVVSDAEVAVVSA